jgi:hypothetical protein
MMIEAGFRDHKKRARRVREVSQPGTDAEKR